MTFQIPLVDLKRQYRPIKKQINTAIQKVINDTAFVSQKYVKEFTDRFAEYCKVKYCVGTGSGTNSLLAAYAAIGLKPGDEVITVANTFTATAEVLHFFGAKPVFIDVDPETFLMDPKKIEQALTKKTKAIVPVHLYGQAAPMNEIIKIAKRHNIKVIEDCAHAQGAMYKNKMVGTLGDIGAYSFNPGKVLGAYGDAGCIITNNKQYAEFADQFINHGRSKDNKYIHEILGLNLRMDGMQGAILNVKLDHLEKWVEKRNQIAALYTKLLSVSEQIKLPTTVSYNRHVYHQFVIQVPRRDELLKHLLDQSIEAGIHYPYPLHKQKAYEDIKIKKVSLPVTEKAAPTLLSLPMFPELTNKKIQNIANIILRFLSEKAN